MTINISGAVDIITAPRVHTFALQIVWESIIVVNLD